MSYVIADIMAALHMAAGLIAFAGMCCLLAVGHRWAEVAEERWEARRAARWGTLAARREARRMERAETYGGRA